MKNILDFLAEIENLAYKILLWLIFIPKTIVQITLNPGWAPDYVRGELKQEKSPFDEYMSPVILLLVVALIPAVIYQYLPTFGVTVTKHVQKESERQDTIEYWVSKNFPVPENTYDAETTFASLSTDMKQRYEWYVEEVVYDENGIFKDYHEIYRETHDETDAYIEHVDLNTTRDTFYFPFERPGDYYINVTVTKYNPEDNNFPLENYDSYLYVYVPDINNEEMKGFISESSTKSKGSSPRLDIELISGQLKKESNIFLVFGLLIPPLFFAFATKLFTRKEISENALREAFYAECYYFAPISLAIWATLYASRFLTNDVFYYYDASILIVFLPTLLALIWFISVETNAIAKEENIVWWKAFLIVLFCLIVLLLVGAFILSFTVTSIGDGTRKLAIWFYPLAAIGLLIILAISSIKSRRRENQRMTRVETFSFGCLFLVIAATIGVILLVGKTIPLEESVVAVTQSADVADSATSAPVIEESPIVTEPPTEAPPTDTPLPEAQQFYTEEFDTNDNNWTYFVVDGATSTITKEDNPEMSVLTDNSLLTFDLNAMNLWVYVIYDSFEYDNVRVDARVTNRGVNNNNVVLICRYTEDGWYEFSVANNGLYWIYAASVDSAEKVEYGLVYNGGSDKIKSGKETNEYSIVCNGPTLSLFINGTEARTITENKYGLTSGKVGISVASFEVLPVSADLDWVTISEP